MTRQTTKRTVTLLGRTAALGLSVLLSACVPNWCEIVWDQSATGGDEGGPDVDVALSAGILRGQLLDNGVSAFLGVRFAGSIPRFEEGRLQTWDGVATARTFAPACPQTDEGALAYQPMSEDCVALNVWTPGADDGARPVMYWIHGGGWAWEDSSADLYNGRRLAARGDVVVVSVNYRLGALGFTHDPADPGGGNLGLQDQLLGLRWVQEHIASLGGDPGNVTIFGESAGAMSVLTLLTTDASDGLVHKAIAQSGALNTVRTESFASAVTERLRDLAGTDDLRSLSVCELLVAQDKLERSFTLSDTLFGPVVDGVLLKEQPLHRMRAGIAADIPLLHGTTRHEASYWIDSMPILKDLPPRELIKQIAPLNRVVGAGIQEMIDAYWTAMPDAKKVHITVAAGSDAFFRVPHLRVADAHSEHQADSWLYRFDWEAGSLDPGLGATHGVEVAFVFDTEDGWPDLYDGGFDADLRDQVMDSWVAFARTGDPNVQGGLSWPRYRSADRQTLLIDSVSHTVADPDGDLRALWDAVPFDGLSPAALPSDL